MADITKEDIREIVGSVLDEKLDEKLDAKFDEKLDPFARMIQDGFVEQRRYLDEKLQEVRLELKDDIHYIHEMLNVITRDLQEIRAELSKVVYRHELEVAVRRIDELERQVAGMRGA